VAQKDAEDSAPILLVGMLDSIHFARWVSQLHSTGFRFVLTGTSPYRKIRPELLEAVSGYPETFVIRELLPKVTFAGFRVLPAIVWMSDIILRDRLRGFFLGRLIDDVKPNLVHANEAIVAGLPLERTLGRLRGHSPKNVWVTNYGSELVARLTSRSKRKRMQSLMSKATYFSAECERDNLLARKLGFRGRTLATIPVSGGLEVLEVLEEVTRRTIAVKGYHNSLGMGADALQKVVTFCRAHPDLGLKIVAFSCNRKTMKVARVSRRLGIDIDALPKGSLTHAQMMDLFSRSIAYVGASKSDGISTSAIEAMANGAIPIQTSSSCANEWFSDGISGFSIQTDDLEDITRALDKIFSAEFDQKRARRMNADVVKARANNPMMQNIAIESYRKVMS
jgi:hypothetical protein